MLPMNEIFIDRFPNCIAIKSLLAAATWPWLLSVNSPAASCSKTIPRSLFPHADLSTVNVIAPLKR